MKDSSEGFGLIPSFIIFGTAGILLFFESHFLIPFLSDLTGFEPIIFWFLVAGIGMFLPMIFVGYLVLRSEGLSLNRQVWQDRLRFKPMKGLDWLVSAVAIIGIMVLSILIMKVLAAIAGKVESQPPFMKFEPLTPDRYWILLLWLPYWILNIMGEEIFWRGVILPKQEVVFGKSAWIYHGLFWGLFHVAFGWQLLLTLVPILFIQSFVVQRQKNTWIGVIVHAVINGPSFIAISFGII